MDDMEFKHIEERDRMGDVEFAALFAELDRVPVTSLEADLERLCHTMADLRRRAALPGR